MLGYKKSTLREKSVVKIARFNKFSLRVGDGGSGALVATDSYNADCREGRLYAGVGGEICYGPTGGKLTTTLRAITGIHHFMTDEGVRKIIVVATGGFAYDYDITTLQVVKRVEVGEDSRCFAMRTENAETYYLLVGSAGGYVTRDGVSFTAVVTGDIRGGCVAGKRFFIAVGENKIIYSAPYDPLQWAGAPHEGGELYMPAACGELVGIAAEGNEVYLLAKRGVYRVRVKAQASDFAVEKIAYGGGEICSRSAISVGGGVLFLATDGLYRIEGDRATRCSLPVSILPRGGTSCRFGRCGELALVQYAGVDGRMKRFATYADGKNGFFIDQYTVFCGEEFYYKGNTLYRFLREGAEVYATTPYFLSVPLRFGTERQKTLRRVRVFGKGEIELRVLNGTRTLVYTVEMKKGEGEVRLCERGREFLFRFALGDGCEVSGFEAEYTCLEE